MSIEEQWNEVAKKHKVPLFKELDAEFDFSSVDETNFPTKALIIKILDKVDYYSAMLSELLQPDTSNIYSMHETRFFDEESKKSIYGLYCKLMECHRRCNELVLINSEKEDCEFVNDFFEEWRKDKIVLINIFKRMGESWKSKSDIKEDLEYFG